MKRKFISFAAMALMSAVALTSCSSDDSGSDIDKPDVESTVLSGTLKDDLTLKAGESYTLDGALIVPDGVLLTIGAGVTITAVDGGEVDFILVQQGGKIEAVGTASQPIVMTAELKEHGAWGGIHICGNAKVNKSGTVSEVGDSTYGGNDDSDNSGILRYVRVEYAGYLYSEEKECNGFTFYGVGNGTTLEYLTAYKGSDDGYEWFGGCVNADYLVSIDNNDDSFDWTYGFRGTINNAYAVQLSDDCDKLIEGDNNSSDFSATPTSHPTIKNATLVGVNRGTDNIGVRIRRGSEITLENVTVYGKTNSLDFQSDETKEYFTSNASSALVNVSANGNLVDAADKTPVDEAILTGLDIDPYMVEPSAPSWVSGAWAEGSSDNSTALVGTVLRGATDATVTLETGKSYELDGAFIVKDGGLLVIEKGVTITAVDGGEVDFILVQQGGMIEAVGTADAPIVMTAELKEHGAWGGIHICGNAVVNKSGTISEVGDSSYGGNDDDDNSGTLSYIRVEYAGYLYSEEKECNGFTFYGVGRGTTLNNLQAYKGSDDGYEWFGGCVNATNLVSVDNNDDSFDWTYGFRGAIDGAYAVQLSDDCDKLIEGDNNSSNYSATPASHPTIKNAVLVGVDRGDDNIGVRIRRGSELTLENAVVVGKTNSFDFQSTETKAFFTANADTALVDVKSDANIIDAADKTPVLSSIFAGLTIDSTLEAVTPDWAVAPWVIL